MSSFFSWKNQWDSSKSHFRGYNSIFSGVQWRIFYREIGNETVNVSGAGFWLH